jgi:hypothetical protein
MQTMGLGQTKEGAISFKFYVSTERDHTTHVTHKMLTQKKKHFNKIMTNKHKNFPKTELNTTQKKKNSITCRIAMNAF